MHTKEEAIDMSRYTMSEEIVDECIGCSRVFDYTPEGGMITSQKCRAYIRPAMWWEKKPVATVPTLVRSQTNPKGVLQNLPVVDFRCPLADHVSAKAVAAAAKVNPLKASKRARKG